MQQSMYGELGFAVVRHDGRFLEGAEGHVAPQYVYCDFDLAILFPG